MDYLGQVGSSRIKLNESKSSHVILDVIRDLAR